MKTTTPDVHDALTRRWGCGAVCEVEMEGSVFVAVVHAADGIRFVTAAGSNAELTCRVAAYVRGRVDDMLPADDARCVHALLAEEDCAGAVERYFGGVGARWDQEWLVTTVVPID